MESRRIPIDRPSGGIVGACNMTLLESSDRASTTRRTLFLGFANKRPRCDGEIVTGLATATFRAVVLPDLRIFMDFAGLQPTGLARPPAHSARDGRVQEIAIALENVVARRTTFRLADPALDTILDERAGLVAVLLNEQIPSPEDPLHDNHRRAI